MTDVVEARRQLDAVAAAKQELDKFRRRARIAGGYTSATLLTDGHAFWVEAWKQGTYASTPQIISLKCETPVGAWKSCCEYLDAR